ncbi:MAG TPA: hypothetical protein PKA63_12850 [Oligoflexia bacterium]|nr:hypothetical protein [Oligoflexia bacterium]HMP49547.1 hypothetical protein [Oligoflexia bacterium]
MGKKVETYQKHVRYFKDRLNIPLWFQVHNGKSHYEKDGIEVIPFEKLVEKMGLP